MMRRSIGWSTSTWRRSSRWRSLSDICRGIIISYRHQHSYSDAIDGENNNLSWVPAKSPRAKTESLCLLLLLLKPHPAVVYNSAFLIHRHIYFHGVKTATCPLLPQTVHTLSIICNKSWPPRRDERCMSFQISLQSSLWLSLTNAKVPVSPVGVLVLLRLPVGVELAVLGDHAVPLAVGVDHAEYPRPPGERVPSATLSIELKTEAIQRFAKISQSCLKRAPTRAFQFHIYLSCGQHQCLNSVIRVLNVKMLVL